MKTPVHKNPRMRILEERIVANSAYSIALDGIKRYLTAKNGILEVSFPVQDFGLPIGLGLEHRVVVEFDPRPNMSIIGRFDDRLIMNWRPDPPGPYPTFTGRLTILPYGTQTEFILKGFYEPPFGAAGAAFDAILGKRIAQSTARALLREFARVLEAEYATLKDVMFRITLA